MRIPEKMRQDPTERRFSIVRMQMLHVELTEYGFHTIWNIL
jgi:hypothetical protein